MLLSMARGVWELRESFALRDGNQKGRSGIAEFYDFDRVSLLFAGHLYGGRFLDEGSDSYRLYCWPFFLFSVSAYRFAPRT